MKTLIIELKKEKRTGIILLMPTLGLLGGAYALLNFIVRKDTLLSLPLAPMTILLTQLYGMIMTLNLFGIIVAACMIYNIEFKGNAVKKMYVLPIHVPAMYLCKFLILTVLLSIAITLQDLALTKIGITNLPGGSFELHTLIRFALYAFITAMPVLSFMLFIASRFENMWISLGIGVAGFLSGMALGVPKIGLYLAEAEKRGLLAAFYLELTTGLRRGELLALQWTDLDVENRTLAVTKQVNRINGELVVSPPKTRNSVRTLALPQQAVDLLIAEHKKHSRNPYLFPSPKTGTMYDPDAFRRTHDKILKAIGAEHIRFHDLRHTFATLSLKSGVDVKTLSGALGHYSAGFTLNTYTHATAQMKQDAADTIGGVISQQMR